MLVQNTSLSAGYMFDPNMSFLDGVMEVLKAFDNWQIKELVDGTVVIGASTFAGFASNSSYVFQRDKDIFSRNIVRDDQEAYRRVCVHNRDFSIKVYRNVQTYTGWNLQANRGKKSVVWRCVSRLENTGPFCEARTVPESQIEQVLVTAINQTLCDKDSFLATLRENIETVIAQENDQTLAGIDARLQELQTELLKLANSKVDYEDVADEIFRLREEKQKVQLENIGRDELKNRIADMSVFLQEQLTAIAEYDEPLVRRLIEKVTVYEDKFTVEFKSGMTVDVEE